MKKFSFGLLIILIALLLSAFTSTSIVSFKDPSFSGIAYNKILIITSINDLGLRNRFETVFQEKLLKKKLNPLISLKVFPPMRTYSEEEIVEILNNNEIQGVMVIKILSFQEKEKYVPSTTQTTTGQAYVYKNNINFSSTTTTSGGYNLETLYVQCHFDFIDVKSGKTIWIAESKTNASGLLFANEKSVTDYISNSVIKKMIEDQLIIEEKKK